MLKRSLASCVAAAALASAVVVPANADVHSGTYKVTVKGNVCNTSVVVDGKDQPLSEFTRDEAKEFLAKSISKIAEAQKELEEALKEEKDGTKNGEIQARIESAQFKIAFNAVERNLTVDCKRGHEGTTFLARSVASYAEKHGLIGSIPGTLGKAGEGKPAPAKNPFVDEKGALNGAGIGLVVGGVLVGVLGLIAAALPAIAPLLPLQLRALLHI